MLKTRIKAGSITNLTDARYFAAWGVEWLGFNVSEGHENYMPATDIVTIKDWVDGVKIVGEFDLLDLKQFYDHEAVVGMDGIQFGQFTDIDLVRQLPSSVFRIQEFVFEHEQQLEQVGDWMMERKNDVHLFLLNFLKNGFSWASLSADSRKYLAQLSRRHPLLLSIEMSSENIVQILEEVNPNGFELKGGEEEKIGYKSFDDIDELFEAIELLV